jgi:hypothetical protein
MSKQAEKKNSTKAGEETQQKYQRGGKKEIYRSRNKEPAAEQNQDTAAVVKKDKIKE